MQRIIRLLTILLVGSGLAAAQSGEGLRAPTNRWHVSGGCSSRSRVSATRVSPDHLEAAWRVWFRW